SLVRRAAYVSRRLQAAMQQATDPQVRQALAKLDAEAGSRFVAAVDPEASWPLSSVEAGPTTAPAAELAEQPFDPVARNALRTLARKSGGIIGYAKTLQDQLNYLTN